MSDEPDDPIDRAVYEARSTFDDANKNPMDHGHVMLKGLDGRTRLASRLKDHDAVDVRTGGYHGTTIHVDGISRYYSAQRGAYDSFKRVLVAEGFDAAADLTLWGRRD